MKETKEHNGIIGFWKFCFCIMIVIFHGRVFASKGEFAFFRKGSIGVEFFFLVSGFLMAKSALSKKDQNEKIGIETIKYVFKKIKGFAPYIFFSSLIGLVMSNIYNKLSIYANISSVWDFLFLNMSGIDCPFINNPTWYISAMLICMMIIYPLIRKYKHNFIYLSIPFVILGLGWMSKTYAHLRSPFLWTGFVYKGLIRGFIELLIGSIIYVLYEKFKNIHFTKFGKIIITLIEIIGFIIPFLLSYFIKDAQNYDFVILLILSVSILLAFSEKTLDFKLFQNKFVFWLEKMSLSLFVCHQPLRLFVQKSSLFTSMTYTEKLSCFVIITFIISLICTYLIEFLKKKHFVEKLKSLIILDIEEFD